MIRSILAEEIKTLLSLISYFVLAVTASALVLYALYPHEEVEPIKKVKNIVFTDKYEVCVGLYSYDVYFAKDDTFFYGVKTKPCPTLFE